MNRTRIALCVLLVLHSVSFGVLGCGQQMESPLRPDDIEAVPKLGDVHYEQSTRQIVLDLLHEGRARQLRLGGDADFRAELRDARGRLEYALGIEGDANELRVVQRNADHALLQVAAIERGVVRAARSSLDGRWIDNDQREPSPELLRELERTGLAASVGDRELLLQLLRDEAVLEHLTSRAQAIAAERGVFNDLGASKRDPNAGEVSCALASLASLSCFCLALPVCWVPCVPAAGTSVACAFAVVVSWVQSWLD